MNMYTLSFHITAVHLGAFDLGGLETRLNLEPFWNYELEE